jgi:hypothetical protein
MNFGQPPKRCAETNGATDRRKDYSRTRSQNLAPPRCGPLRSRLSTWLAPTLRSQQSWMVRNHRRRVTKADPIQRKRPSSYSNYLRDSFTALKKSLAAITVQNMYDPIEGPYAGPNTRLGLGLVSVWHVADHYGQAVIYLRENGIVPPASRSNPPQLKEKY